MADPHPLPTVSAAVVEDVLGPAELRVDDVVVDLASQIEVPEALEQGDRLLSAYHTSTGEKIWIITEAVNDEGKRASTTILLPEEY